MVILNKANVFLIQAESTRKHLVASKVRTRDGFVLAEDILLHNRFTITKALNKKHPEFNQMEKGDYVVVYCNSPVPHSPNQIKFVYQLKNKLNRTFVLTTVQKLRRGYILSHLQSLVEEGKLSRAISNCGENGFVITQISFSDLELIINYDPLVRTYSSSSWKE
jgi:hypothetical protein